MTYCTGKRTSTRFRSDAWCTCSRWCSSDGPSYHGMRADRVTMLSPCSAETGTTVRSGTSSFIAKQENSLAIADEFSCFAMKLEVPDLTVVPVSALHGDNIVTRSARMPWYEGPSLLHHLEHVHHASDRNLVDVRFPVQYVIRPQSTVVSDYRGYAGQVASGVLKPGDEVMVLPSGFTTRIAGIDTAAGPVDEAYPPMSVTVRLADELDVARGDMICRPHNAPTVAQDIEAMICWMDETRPLTV